MLQCSLPKHLTTSLHVSSREIVLRHWIIYKSTLVVDLHVSFTDGCICIDWTHAHSACRQGAWITLPHRKLPGCRNIMYHSNEKMRKCWNNTMSSAFALMHHNCLIFLLYSNIRHRFHCQITCCLQGTSANLSHPNFRRQNYHVETIRCWNTS